MAAMFFPQIKNPQISSMQDTPRNIQPIGQVVSEKKIFERNNIENSQKNIEKRQ